MQQKKLWNQYAEEDLVLKCNNADSMATLPAKGEYNIYCKSSGRWEGSEEDLMKYLDVKSNIKDISIVWLEDKPIQFRDNSGNLYTNGKWFGYFMHDAYHNIPAQTIGLRARTNDGYEDTIYIKVEMEMY